MPGPIDETFTEQQLIPGTVLEFGCNPGYFTARMAARPDLTVTAIGLYGSDTTAGLRFIKGDLMDLEFSEQFDNVCCVSSFEHAGIERYEFDKGAVNLDYHKLVAAKLVSLVKPGGRLIVTCPLALMKFGSLTVKVTISKPANRETPSGDSVRSSWKLSRLYLHR